MVVHIMGILDKLKKKMPEMQKKGDEIIDPAMPSDEELQNSRAARRKTADDVTGYLAEKGYPTLGAIAGTVTDLSADLIPESREQYKEGLVGGGTTGTVGKLTGKMPNALTKLPKEALEGVAESEAPLVFSKLSKEAQHLALSDAATARQLAGLTPEEIDKRFAELAKKKLQSAQNIKDVASGIKKPGSTTAKSEAFEQDYSALNAPTTPAQTNTIDYRTLTQKNATKSDNRASEGLGDYWKKKIKDK